MLYEQYGITRDQVERVKRKMKNTDIKERVKRTLSQLTKADLQNRGKVRHLVKVLSKQLGESLTPKQEEHIVSFVIDQKIDPNNTFHLLKLWGMFR